MPGNVVSRCIVVFAGRRDIRPVDRFGRGVQLYRKLAPKGYYTLRTLNVRLPKQLGLAGGKGQTILLQSRDHTGSELRIQVCPARNGSMWKPFLLGQAVELRHGDDAFRSSVLAHK